MRGNNASRAKYEHARWARDCAHYQDLIQRLETTRFDSTQKLLRDWINKIADVYPRYLKRV